MLYSHDHKAFHKTEDSLSARWDGAYASSYCSGDCSESIQAQDWTGQHRNHKLTQQCEKTLSPQTAKPN